MVKRPNSRRNLDLALEKAVGRADFVAKRIVVANALVAQMLPAGSVKGGSAIKLRLGDGATRFTTDLDVVRRGTLDKFADELDAALAKGWEGFTGTLAAGRKAHPKDVPTRYVMQPFAVKLSYNGKPWMSVELEVGHDEVGAAADADFVVPRDANAILGALGFPPLEAVSVMALRHQIAQKLHAVSAAGSMRAHDLIDLQLLDAIYEGDYSDVRTACERLFAYRKMQDWPPVVEEGKGWRLAYADQLPVGDLATSAGEAVEWVNALIGKIDAAPQRCGRLSPPTTPKSNASCTAFTT